LDIGINHKLIDMMAAYQSDMAAYRSDMAADEGKTAAWRIFRLFFFMWLIVHPRQFAPQHDCS
jgi:hypothetical protein